MQSNDPTTPLAGLVPPPGKRGQATGNRCGMGSGKAMRLILMGVVSLAITLVSVGEVDASCSGSQRMRDANADCLNSRYSNSGNWLNPSSEFYAWNSCHNYGKVVAKVDIKNRPDVTWHLTSNAQREGQADEHVRDIYCCKDLSVLCKRSDVVNPDGCLDQFRKSPAKKTQGCSLYEVPTVTGTISNLRCNFPAAWCPNTRTDGTTEVLSSSLSQVLWYVADELINCNGVLRRAGSC